MSTFTKREKFRKASSLSKRARPLSAETALQLEKWRKHIRSTKRRQTEELSERKIIIIDFNFSHYFPRPLNLGLGWKQKIWAASAAATRLQIWAEKPNALHFWVCSTTRNFFLHTHHHHCSVGLMLVALYTYVRMYPSLLYNGPYCDKNVRNSL